jgi:fluoride exporter
MFLASWIGVSLGAALGALLRWRLSIVFNPVFPTIPLGTLCANLVGGLLMGFVTEYLAQNAAVPPAVRLAVTTGFLGGLTTFSTFSAETVTLLFHEEYGWSLVEIVVHVAGSVAMTILGVLCVRLLMSLKGAT